MKSWIRESLVIAVCAAVIITAVYALYKEMTVRIEKNSSDAIGVIIFKKKNTERKYADYVIWEDITANAPVYNYDSVRTFKGSAAYIRLKSGAEISLDEDTMIVLIADEKGVNINFDRGSVSAKSGKVYEKISLNTKNASISLNKGELAVKKVEDTVDVNVSSGEALIDTGSGDIRKIDNSTVVQVIRDKTEVKKINIIQESPSNNAYFVTYRNSDTINFKWKSNSSEDDIFQLSRDLNFSNIIYTSKASGGSHAFNITPGDYYWRVVSGAESSPSRKITLLRDTVPEQFYPVEKEKVSVSEDAESVSFRWSRSEHVSSYEFELALDPEMIKNVKKIKVNNNAVAVGEIPAGSLWWRITRIYPDGFTVIDGSRPVSGFNLEKVSIERVKPRPLHDREMHVSTLAENIIFNWESGVGTKDFTVDISSDNQFKKIIRSSSAAMNFYNAGKLPEGRYFWRVRANYGKGESTVSETVTMIVAKPEPVIYLAPLSESIIPNTVETLQFVWRDNSETGNYLFEMSADSDFKKIIAFSRTESKKHIMKNPGAGKFYWRVSIIDRSAAITVRGLPAAFTVPEILKKPSVISPLNMGTLNLDNLDLIKFQWEKVAGADSYEIEIFQRASGSDRSLIVLNTDSPMIELRNFKLLYPGTLVWVVRAKKIVKGVVAASSESDRNYFILKVNEEIPAPKSKVSGTIYVR